MPYMPPERLGSGPGGGKFLRDDKTWQPAGGIADFGIDMTDLTTTGDYWGFPELNATVDSTVISTVNGALYLAADGHYELAKADVVGTMPCSALALATGTGVMDIFTWGWIYNSGWTFATVGGNVYVSKDTAGALVQTVSGWTIGKQVQIVGIARATHILEFKPLPPNVVELM